MVPGCNNKKDDLPRGEPSTEVDLAAGGPLPPKVAKPLDVSFILPEAVFALVADPYQLMKSENVPLLNQSLVVPMLAADMGVRTDDVEQLILFGGPGKKLTDFFVGTIVRFKQPPNQEEQLYRIAAKWEEATEGDKKYHRGSDGRCAYFADDRTLLMATEETLKKMLAVAADAESPLLKRLRESTDAAALLAVLEIAPIRGQIGAFLLFSKLPSPFDKPPLDAIREVPKNVDEVTMEFLVTPVADLTLKLHAKDEEAAIATDALIANLLEKFGDAVDEMTGGEDAGREAAVIQELFDTFKSRLQRKRDGQLVNVHIGGKPFQNQLIMIGPSVMQSIQKSWIDANQQLSRQKLERIGAALDQELASKGAYPAPANLGADGQPLLSWRVHLLPALGEQALYDEFHLDEPWNSEHNKKLLVRIPEVYRLPGQLAEGKTYYVLPTGAGTVFADAAAPKADSITDAKNQTILLVDCSAGKPVEWTKPIDLKFDRGAPAADLTNVINSKFRALFADGVVRQVDTKRHAAVLIGLFSPAGGEEIDAELTPFGKSAQAPAE